MKYVAKILVLAGLITLLNGRAGIAAIIDSTLENKLNSSSPEVIFDVFLWFENQTDVKGLSETFDASSSTLAERHAVIVGQLKETATVRQQEILNLLEEGKSEGDVIKYDGYWIANFINVEARRDFIFRLAERPELSEIFEDFEVHIIEPVRDYDMTTGGDNPAPSRVEAGLEAIGAPQMWEAGYTGIGRVVMNIDTGVDGNHIALSDRWVGNNGFPASQGWLDTSNPNSDFPFDSDGHGTHTMGTITGLGESSGDTIGVAFGALWIAARAIVDGGNAASAFQWGADPDGNPNTMHDVPDVISNSWGAGNLGCFETYWQIIDNVEAVGPVVVFSAGNDGPGSETCGSPANRPASPTNSFAVGAVDGHNSNYPIAGFSGRGPSICDHSTIKPEVVAPGVNVRSSVPGGGYQSIGWSGTSMSCPHVGGAVALLRQYNPNATADAIKTALMESAMDLGNTGEDNTYGWGIINVYEAMQILEGNSSPYIRQYGANYSDGDNDLPDPGETGEIVVTLWNTGTQINNVYSIITSTDPFVQINSDSAFYGNMMPGDTLNNSGQPFNVTFHETTPRGRSITIDVHAYGDGDYSSDSRLIFQVGSPAEQAIAKHNIGNAQFSISNFGHYGLASGSMIYFPGGIGFKYPYNRSSHIYEAGLIIGTGPEQISDCVRNEAQEVVYDFLPTNEITEVEPGTVSDQDFHTSFNDQGAANPMGVDIFLNTYMWEAEDYDDFVVLEYLISNYGGSSLDLYVGHFDDWDFPWGSATSDRVDFSRSHRLGYMFQNPSSNYRGVAVLSEEDVTTFRALQNETEVYPPRMSDQDKWDFMTAGFVDTAVTAPEDAAYLISTGPITIGNTETKKAVFAYIGGTSLEEIRNHAIAAFDIYWASTAVDDGEYGTLPREVGLSQNYPNPFNAQTSIKFSLPTASHIKLEVYNLMGQVVETLIDGIQPAGINVIRWNAEENSSGIYFYKLSVDDNTITKRMTLLK